MIKGWKLEERVGFEPTIPITRDNGFQDRRIQPLCHLSVNSTGAPGRSRTYNLQIRSLTLCPIELRAHIFQSFCKAGGESGIRTHAPGFPDSCLAGKRFKPLSHLSIYFIHRKNTVIYYFFKYLLNILFNYSLFFIVCILLFSYDIKIFVICRGWDGIIFFS